MLHVAIALPLPDAGEPEVELLDILVLADRPGVAAEDEAPVLHHVPVLREPERHRGVLLGEQHGHPRLAVHPAHDLEDLVHQHRREPHRGLVEQHEPGPRHERAADRHHLLLAARDVAGADQASLRQPGKVAIHEREVLLRRVAVLPRVAAGEEVLLHGQVLEDVPALHYLDDSSRDDLGRVLPMDRLPLHSIVPLVTSPRSVRSSPEIAFSVVLLPAPLAPRRATMPPAGTRSETPFNTRITWS